MLPYDDIFTTRGLYHNVPNINTRPMVPTQKQRGELNMMDAELDDSEVVPIESSRSTLILSFGLISTHRSDLELESSTELALIES